MTRALFVVALAVGLLLGLTWLAVGVLAVGRVGARLEWGVGR